MSYPLPNDSRKRPQNLVRWEITKAHGEAGATVSSLLTLFQTLVTDILHHLVQGWQRDLRKI